ncbi:RNA-binding S4 domain-containing protein [Photobacterium galatheae]|uniref:Urease n=1 Tax=Photobacterium galatheae TaxID=1654360 RepID=A0A066RQV1_9GAMM|nr:RNA-binding S4 domain-containing protein [Photobacterium galatheae]KDM92825.1 Urease [Photobacterium galatheae]MCM0148211.1 RNA-binding S4 domain-containing protein [Photobacterium galatheae]
MSQDQEIEVEALGIEVSAQPIELYKVLKIANAVGGGGEAKMAIAEGYVAVNGELEQRKRRKVYDSDVIEFNEEFYVVLCDQPVTETAREPVAKSKAKNTGKSQPPVPSAPKRPAKQAKQKPAHKGGNQKSKTRPSATIGKNSDEQTGRKRLMF